MFLAYHVQGYLVGNPVTDNNFDGASRIPFVHGMGIISDEIYEVRMDNSTTLNSTMVCVFRLNLTRLYLLTNVEESLPIGALLVYQPVLSQGLKS